MRHKDVSAPLCHSLNKMLYFKFRQVRIYGWALVLVDIKLYSLFSGQWLSNIWTVNYKYFNMFNVPSYCLKTSRSYYMELSCFLNERSVMNRKKVKHWTYNQLWIYIIYVAYCIQDKTMWHCLCFLLWELLDSYLCLFVSNNRWNI